MIALHSFLQFPNWRPMPYILELEIPDLPMTYNELGRKHWAVKAKEAKKWINMIHILSSGTRPEEPLKRAKITFTRMSPRKLDPDNIPQSFKHVMDGLVEAGILENDREENIVELKYKQVVCKKFDRGIKIKVEEAQ